MADPPTFAVDLTHDALEDLASIAEFRAQRRGIDEGEALLNILLERARSLQHYPRRGPRPKELTGQGEDEVRQLVHGPYRIIYEVADGRVLVVLVADGRRDMQRLLRGRLQSLRGA